MASSVILSNENISHRLIGDQYINYKGVLTSRCFIKGGVSKKNFNVANTSSHLFLPWTSTYSLEWWRSGMFCHPDNRENKKGKPSTLLVV